FAVQQVQGQFLSDHLEQVPHLHLALIERRLLDVVPVQALDGNGQLVCHSAGVYASFHLGPPLVSGRHHTPLCSSCGGPILLFLLCFSLHQDKITPTRSLALLISALCGSGWPLHQGSAILPS